MEMTSITKNIGKIFEHNFKTSCPDWLLTYKPPDAAQSFNMNNKLRFSQHSPCDYMLFNGNSGKMYALELKTFEGSCSFERTKAEKGSIHYHQIESLKKFATFPNVISGLILDFRKSGTTYFLSIDEFCRMIQKIPKKSFNENDMFEWCHPVIIQKKKLKVNYRYDIEKFLKDTTA